MQSELIKNGTNDGSWIIDTDDTMREIRSHGTGDFPFQCYSELFDWRYNIGDIGWHWHRELEFVLVQEGAIEYQAGDRVVSLKKGDCAMINSGVIHHGGMHNAGEKWCRFINFLFLPELVAPGNSAIYRKYVEPALDSGADVIVFNRDIPWRKRICEWLENLWNICRTAESMPELQIHINVCNLWLELAAHVNEYREQPKTDRNIVMQARLRKMMQFVWENYTERISADDIAGAANISQSAALRCFRAGTNMSPVEYLNDYRLRCAKEKLLTTHSMISEIALSVGFESVGYFNRLFKREFGMTPRQFIQQETSCKK